jgi:hypothetical protein
MQDETAYLCPFIDHSRAPGAGGRPALSRRVCPAPLSARAGQCSWPSTAPHCPAPGLQRSDGAQRGSGVQHGRPCLLAQTILSTPYGPSGVRSRPGRGASRAVTPTPTGLRPTPQPLDTRSGGRGVLRARPHRTSGQWRDHSRRAGPPGGALAACQAVDHQPRSGVYAKKKARDRLIRLAGHHPDWALGFEDETWWSRVVHPQLHVWAPTPQPLRLVEQTLAKTDPDPNALACYGLLLRWLSAPGVPEEAVWLRFVEGRPVSAITTAFLAWSCRKLTESYPTVRSRMCGHPAGPDPGRITRPPTVIQENNAGFADPAAITEHKALGGGPAHVEDHELGSDARARLGRLSPHSRCPVAGGYCQLNQTICTASAQCGIIMP